MNENDQTQTSDFTNDEIEFLLSLKEGDKISYRGHEVTFERYDTSQVPINNSTSSLIWYPNRAIWSDDVYENIRFNCLKVKLIEVDEIVPLKEFKQL